MNFTTLAGFAGKIQHANLGVLLWDESVDVVMIEQSILGPSVRLMERLPRDEAVFETLAARLATLEKRPSRVVVCLPRAETALRTMRYPAVVQADLEQMVPFEATRHLPFSEAERCLGYTSVLSEDGQQVDVQLLAARKGDVQRIGDAFDAIGLPIDMLLSFSPLVAAEVGAVPALLVVSDAGHVELSLICGGLVCDSMLVPRTGAPPLNELAQRLIAAQGARLGAAGVAKLLIAGPVPLDGESRDALGTALGLFATELSVSESVEAALTEFEGEVLAEGLCVAGSLLPASLSLVDTTRKSVPMARRTKWILGLAALLLVELLAGWGLWTFSPSRARAGVEKELAAIRRRADPVQQMKEQNRSMRNELVQLHELVNTRVSVMDLFQTLSDTFPEDTYLTAIDYERGGRMKVKGKSKEPDKLPALLLSVPFVSTIEASDIDEKKGSTTPFR